MLAQQHQTPTLSITAHGASNLKDVESFGKQDPYFRFTLDITNPKSFQKTFVHKNAGKNPVWNQSFNTPLNGEQDLFIEIMDEENTTDAVIAFAAIPLNQVIHAHGGNLNAIFPVYTPDGKQNGEVTLTLTAHNVPGQNAGYQTPGFSQDDAQYGVSRIVDVHLKRVKALKNKEKATDAGIAVAGGLFALGAGLLANKLNNDHNKEEQAKKDAELEQQQEREQFEEEKRRLEAEQQKFQSDQEAYQKQQQEQQHHHQTTTETHYEHRHEHHGSRREWDAVGSYTAGDKVEYHGRVYICLQGHVSNPTWEPTVASSLWRAD
ncbi:hypothetical protein BGX24_009591 [Mortierella sp. AD032]|nr:hypothetical protein BGX24_009591 [Mortierella sp. AD032]